MSYRHILSTSGIVHGQPDDSDWLVCGKANTDTIGASIWEDTDDPITCKVCKRSIEASRDFRVARELTTLARSLHDDMTSRPGAYIHADRSAIQMMMLVIDSE